MTLTAIILIVITGLILILLEVLVLPGGIVGVIGFILILIGIYLGFQIDNQTGVIILISSVVLSGGTFYAAFKSKTWEKLSLKTNIDSSSSINEGIDVKIGEKGLTLTRLNPMGKATFHDKSYEVKTNDDFIDEEKEIEIINIKDNLILVKENNNG